MAAVGRGKWGVRLGLRAGRNLQRGVWDQEPWAQLLVFPVETGAGWSGSTAWAVPQVRCGERGVSFFLNGPGVWLFSTHKAFSSPGQTPTMPEAQPMLLSRGTKASSFYRTQGTRRCIRSFTQVYSWAWQFLCHKTASKICLEAVEIQLSGPHSLGLWCVSVEQTPHWGIGRPAVAPWSPALCSWLRTSPLTSKIRPGLALRIQANYLSFQPQFPHLENEENSSNDNWSHFEHSSCPRCSPKLSSLLLIISPWSLGASSTGKFCSLPTVTQLRGSRTWIWTQGLWRWVMPPPTRLPFLLEACVWISVDHGYEMPRTLLLMQQTWATC